MVKNLISGAAIASLPLTTASCSSSQQTTNGASRRQIGQASSTEQIMKDLDTKNDGNISKSEAKGPLDSDFSKVDANKDGYISKEEFEKHPNQKVEDNPDCNLISNENI